MRVAVRDANIQRNQKVRAAFVARGTSFHAWCKKEGIDPHNARKAILGQWTGPKADTIIKQIEAALELQE